MKVIPLTTFTEKIVVKEQRKGEAKIASISPYPGHTVFKFTPDGKLREVTEDDYEETLLTMAAIRHRKLIKEKGTIYISALNIKNAIKKLRKLGVVK